MSNFFRDSNLFTSRNNKPLFPTNISSSSKNKLKYNKESTHFLNGNNDNKDRHVKHKGRNTENKEQTEDYDDTEETVIAEESKIDKENEAKYNKYKGVKISKSNDFHSNDDASISEHESEEKEKQDVDENNYDNEDDDDDDIKITDVRDIADLDDAINTSEIADTSNHKYEYATSSQNENDQVKVKTELKSSVKDNVDDVSIEYLLNTISHLNNKNSKFQRQVTKLKNDNENLKKKFITKSELVSSLKNQITKINANISDSRIILKNLKNDYYLNKAKTDSINNEINDAKNNILKHNENILFFKKLIGNMKLQISNNDSLINQRNQQIETLRKRSDDLAGRLSEEKIKNTELNNTFNDEIKRYETQLIEINGKHEKLVESVINENKQVRMEWNAFMNESNLSNNRSATKILDLFENLKLNLNDNFNDIMIRVTSLGASNDAIKAEVSNVSEKMLRCKDETISALSNIDQNIVNHMNKSIINIIQKLDENCTSSEVKKITEKVLETVNNNLKNEKIIDSLQKQKLELIEKNLSSENIISLLKMDVKAKDKEIEKLNGNITNLKTENNELLNSQLSIINDLQQKESELLNDIEICRKQYSDAMKDHEVKINSANASNKKIEEQNIRIFNEEKKKVACLNKELENYKQKFEDLKVTNKLLINEIDDLKKMQTERTIELCNLKKNYESESDERVKNETKAEQRDEIIATLNRNLQSLNADLSNKEQIINKLQTTIASYEKELKDYKCSINENKLIIQNLKETQGKGQNNDNVSKLEKAAIFPDSRTSTAKAEPIKVKQEKFGKSYVPTTKKVKSKSKRITKPTIQPFKEEKKDVSITTLQNNQTTITSKSTQCKRKLLGSSQDSAKTSQSLQRKKQEILKNNILQDLDIFNEFNAIDRLGTIGKPGW